MIRPVAPILLLLLASAPAWADYELGLQAYRRGDFGVAVAQWRPMAEGGHAESQYRMGRVYYAGEGVEADPAVAADWYRRAAEQGHAEARVNLGYLYEHGEGVEASDERAAHWYGLAAEQGLPYAQYALARFHLEGRGVAANDQRAAFWCRKAAQQGLPAAQHQLGRLFEAGRGVERDPKKAARWLRRAAKQGFRGDAPEASPPAGAPAATRTPLPARQAADLAPEEAYRRATALRMGDGVERDEERAARLYLQAAEAGHGRAAYQVAFLFLRGRVLADRPDFVRAWAWFDLGARQEVGDAAAWRDRIAGKMSEKELLDARSLAQTLPRE